MYVKLWELLRSVPLTGETPDLDMEINSISYDTRTIKPGALFAALPGARDDGARHIREALDRGAAAVLCRERPEEDGPWLVTPESPRPSAPLWTSSSQPSRRTATPGSISRRHSKA